MPSQFQFWLGRSGGVPFYVAAVMGSIAGGLCIVILSFCKSEGLLFAFLRYLLSCSLISTCFVSHRVSLVFMCLNPVGQARLVPRMAWARMRIRGRRDERRAPRARGRKEEKKEKRHAARTLLVVPSSDMSPWLNHSSSPHYSVVYSIHHSILFIYILFSSSWMWMLVGMCVPCLLFSLYALHLSVYSGDLLYVWWFRFYLTCMLPTHLHTHTRYTHAHAFCLHFAFSCCHFLTSPFPPPTPAFLPLYPPLSYSPTHHISHLPILPLA